jgi:type IV pilus assembly protein PilA
MSKQRGFSLIELLIVVAVILVIAAIAIPNFLRSRIAANEASAVNSVKNINTAQIAYAASYPNVGYADNLSKLGPATPPTQNRADLLDSVLGCAAQPCQKAGYSFTIVDVTGAPAVTNFRVTAVPITRGTTGERGFCSNQLSEMTVDPAGGVACTIPLQ